jgi:sulfite exporter TauE/SafE
LISSFGIGIIHGFAGIAHFLLLLPVLGFQAESEGMNYVAGFGIGTVLAMTAYALVLGKLSRFSKKEHHLYKHHRYHPVGIGKTGIGNTGWSSPLGKGI